MGKPRTIKIDEVEYVRKDSIKTNEEAEKMYGLEYKIVRTYSAGVFAGYLKEYENGECVLLNARRLWRWSGAASLSQLAMEGISKPEGCKFPCEVTKIKIIGVIEVIDCTEKSRASISGVKIWSE